MKLNLAQENNQPTINPNSSKIKRIETEARFERIWLLNPEQFNPMRNCMERERVKRTIDLLKNSLELSRKKTIDLGCAAGEISRRLRNEGAVVEAVDIAQNALKAFRNIDSENIRLNQDYIPRSSLPDNSFDLVVCTDLIAYLPVDDYRLTMSELSRIVTKEGYVICSTPIDINSVDALQRFTELAETEFRIEKWVYSYHALYIRLIKFLELPSTFCQAWKDKQKRTEEIKSRPFISRFWFRLNTSFPFIYFWFAIAKFSDSILKKYKQSQSTLLKLEKICHFFYDLSGISHAIFLGQRKPLLSAKEIEEELYERPKKKEIWE